MQLLRTPLGSGLLETDSAGRNLAAPATLPLNLGPQTLASRRVVRLRAGETLIALGDIELTDDVISRAGAELTRFDIRASLGLVLATSPSSTTGVELTPFTSTVISWREHHYTFTPNASRRIPSSLAGRTMYVNVVADAAMRNPPSGCVAPYSGVSVPCAVTVERQLDQLAILRVPPGAHDARALAPTAVTDVSLPAPLYASPAYGHRRVVWSSAPIDLRQGDVIKVTARVLASAAALERGLPRDSSSTTGCNALFSGQLYLSPSRDRVSGPSLPALSGDTGLNLTQADPTAEWREQGAWQVPNSDFGRRSVDLVAWSARSVACPERQVAILGGASAVDVDIYGTNS